MGAQSPFREFSVKTNLLKVVFQPGENIEGQVNTDLIEGINLQWINLVVYGSCVVHTQANNSENELPDLSDSRDMFEEVYINHQICLWGNETDGFCEFLEAGKHHFPFVFHLPGQIPHSFRGKHGYITYRLEANLCKLESTGHKQIYQTVTNIDIRPPRIEITNSNLKGVDSAPQKTYTSKDGKLSCLLKLNSLWQTTGSDLVLDIGIENSANKDSPIVGVLLTRIIVYHTGDLRRYKIERNDISQYTFGKIPSKSYMIWKNQRLQIPCLAPPNIFQCSLIDVQYFVRVVLDKSTDILNLPVRVNQDETDVHTLRLTTKQNNEGGVKRVKNKKKSFLEKKLSNIESIKRNNPEEKNEEITKTIINSHDHSSNLTNNNSTNNNDKVADESTA